LANLTVVHGEWVNLDKPGGQVFFVADSTSGGTYPTAYKGKGSSGSNNGLSPQKPINGVTTGTTDGLNALMDKCVSGRGDTIVVLPGSIINTAVVTVDVADLTITGISPSGSINPSAIVVNATVDGFNVTAANVVLENLHFGASTAAATSRINAGAAGLTIRGCTFDCGANDVESITVPAAGDDLLVENCRFYVTANGPDAAIEIEAAGAERLTVRSCVFSGDTDTNKWDAGAINSGVAHTGCLIDNNVFWEGLAVEFTAAATGIICRNFAGEGATLGQAFDPGSCMCFENYEADAVDQSGRLFPDTVAS
jgi:hypothetical protein